MSDVALRMELEAAIERDEPFEPAGDDAPLREVPATTLREVILAPRDHPDGAKRLWLRRVQVTEKLDLEAQHVGLRLRLEDCELKEDLVLRQTRAIDIALYDCVFGGRLRAGQLELRWNLRLNGSKMNDGVELLGARVGGQLSMNNAMLKAMAGEDGEVGSGFAADDLEVSKGFFCDGMSAEGEVRLLGAKVGGQLSMNNAVLKAIAGKDGEVKPAFAADRIDASRGIFCNGMSAEGEVRLLGAKVGGQLSMNNAVLKAIAGEDAEVGSVLTADGIEASGGIFCDGMSAEGEVRLLGAKVKLLSMNEAALKAIVGRDGEVRPAFNGDRSEVDEGMFCDGMSAEGEVRLLGAKVGGQLSMSNVALKAIAGKDGEVRPAFNGDGIKVSDGMFCDGMSAEGEVRLLGGEVGGQLALVKTQLAMEAPDEDCLALVGAKSNELIIALDEVKGVINLTDAKVRSLWDAGGGEFLGQLPDTIRLQGFRYDSLREPLSARKRLEWIERSQQEQHYPGVYAELAEAYRSIGRREDAREIGIANERRAREDGSGLYKIWNYLLWATVRYGYENWRAVVWLLAVITAGSILFCVGGDHFVATAKEHPDFSPVIYATDAAIPVLDLGQTRTWTADGLLRWVELLLAISGYALVAAVIAGLAGIFNRDQV